MCIRWHNFQVHISLFLCIIFKEWPLEATGGNGRKIQLTFESFNLEYHSRCVYDYVEVSFGTFKEKYCGPNSSGFYYNGNGDNIGTSLPGPFISTGKTMKVRFRTDAYVTGTGFKADWNEV